MCSEVYGALCVHVSACGLGQVCRLDYDNYITKHSEHQDIENSILFFLSLLSYC